MALVQVQSGGVTILRCPLAGLLAMFPALLSLLPSLCHWVAVSTCLHKVKHHIVAPLRVPRLAVPHLALMLTARRLMHTRISSLQTGMPMYARALRWLMTMTTMPMTVISMTPWVSEKSSALHSWPRLLSTLILFLAPSTLTSESPALTFSFHSPHSPLLSPLLLHLLLLVSPFEIQEFALS